MTVLDKLVTQLGFETDLSALRRFDGAVTRIPVGGWTAYRTQMFGVGRAVGIVGGAATGVFGLAAKQAINWESDFTGVRKTVDATEAEFEVLESTLRRMAREDVPLPVGELAALAESAGQLGIETDSIDEFVKVIAQLGTTTNLAAEEGATQLARFANITGMSQDDFDRLGSTVVDLGNNFATTEAEIVGMSLRSGRRRRPYRVDRSADTRHIHRANIGWHQRRSGRHRVQSGVCRNGQVRPNRRRYTWKRSAS